MKYVWWLLALLVVVLIAAAAVWYLFGGSDSQQPPLADNAQVQQEWDLVTDPNETTDDFCDGGHFRCIEAWSTNQADYLRFETNEEAEKVAQILDGITFVADEVVIRFIDEDLTENQRAELALNFDGTYDS